MNPSPEKADPASPRAPAHYRLVVRSAAEAVALVRERFGARARVLSVKQLEAGGLGRFLQKPRLEMIVEVDGTPGDTSPAEQLLQASARPAASLTTSTAPASAPAPSPAHVAPPVPPPADAARRGSSLLRAVGFDEVLLERIRTDHPGLDWDATPMPEALAHLVAWLRRHFDLVPRRPAGPRRVYLGGCGVGKTTAMCKALALDVFVNSRQPAVLKLDGDQPGATDGIAAFCDVLGAPLLRSAAEVEEFDRDSLLYVDLPGTTFDAHAEHARLAQVLDALHIDTRVLVINATCESETIADAYALGRACGATHVVFTHLDELRRPGKLWRFALQGGLRPLFLSAGPSPTGEIEEDVFGALLARTFPRGLAALAGADGGRR